VALTDRFQLFDLRRDEGARTFEAREIATGRPVLVHLFGDCTAPLNRALLTKLDALPEHERRRIIERGEHEGGVYVVTDRLVEYAGLREWLEQKPADAPKSLESASAWRMAPEKVSIDDQLANMFDTAPRPMLEPSPTAPPPSPVLTTTGEATLKIPKPVELPKPPAQTANEPGEFTRQFAPVLRPAPPPGPPPAAAAPGEFTSLFAARPVKDLPPKPEQTVKPEQPVGEFTKLFQTPPRPAAEPPARVEAPGPTKTSSQDGEFTRMLKAQRPAPAGPLAPAAKNNDFENYFQPSMAPPPTQPFRPNIPPNIPPSGRTGRDGDFTQVFGPGSLPAPPPQPIAPAVSSSGATQVFRAPAPAMVPGPPPVMTSGPALGANAPVTSEPARSQGPDDWGRMFETPAALTFGQEAVAPRGAQLPEAPVKLSRNSSRLPLLLIIGAAVLLIAALIVYLVMRPRSG
jgi:hypothetical protein